MANILIGDLRKPAEQILEFLKIIARIDSCTWERHKALAGPHASYF